MASGIFTQEEYAQEYSTTIPIDDYCSAMLNEIPQSALHLSRDSSDFWPGIFELRVLAQEFNVRIQVHQEVDGSKRFFGSADAETIISLCHVGGGTHYEYQLTELQPQPDIQRGLVM